MKKNFSRTGFARAASNCLIPLVLSVLALPTMLPAQTLLHRYSFATDASDSVGGANGTIIAPTTGGAASISGGLVLPGSGGGFGTSGYVSLPNGILTNTASLTVECWFTQNSANTWATPWDFGNNGSQNFALIPHPGNNGNNMEVAFTPNGNERDLQSAVAFPNGLEQYVALTYNNSTLVGNLYTNGILVATTTLPNTGYTPGTIGGTGGTTENMLGNDVYGDPQFNGTVYELRIWNGAVSQRYLGASTLVGPGVLITSLTPTSMSLTAGPGVVITGTEQATVTVQLSQTGTTNIIATADATNWSSANPSVVTVNSSGLITGVGVGTTTVSATVAGVTATSGIIIVTPQTLQHRYSFISDASDSVGTANGTLVAPTTGGAATISSGLHLPGTTTGGFGVSGYVALPNGIVQGDSSVTVECWVTQNQPNTWAEIWDFGSSGAINFALIPASPTPNMRVPFSPNNNDVDLNAPALPTGSEQYVVLTYNNSTLTGNLYLNAALDGSVVLPNTSYSPGTYGGVSGTTENMLGNDVYGDDQFNGTIYELRIWNGAVTPLYIDVSAAAGSGTLVTNLTPSLVNVTVTNSSMIGAQTQQASVTANFTAASGVVVTGAATNWTSSNTNILTVSSGGLITALSGGSATISATVGGVTAASGLITVQLTVPTITSQPSSATLVVGDSVTFTVGALGGNLSYQWKDNSISIPGATNTSLTLTNLTLAQAGSYTVFITNSLGSTNSTPAVLSVATSILQHRYSFVSDASDPVGHANGTLNPGNNAATINNGLSMPGTGTSANPSGYVALPNGIVAGDTSVTVECWVTQNQANSWAEIWSFGVAGGSVNFGLIPAPDPGRNGGNMMVAFTPNGGEIDLTTATTFPNGSQQYVAVTYDNSILTGNLYLNGALDGSTVFPSSAYSPGNYGSTTEDVFGLDPFGGDAMFNGTLSELRIWKGVVSPLYVAISAAAGPGTLVTNLTPTSVSVTASNLTLIGGQTEQAAATGNFAAASGIPITSLVTNWISSNPGVLTVNSNGLITAVGTGTATVSATFAGVTGTSSTVTVSASAPVITLEPQASETLLTGATLSATLAVQGSTPFTFYWYFNNGATPILVSSSPTLTIHNVQPASAGSYACVVSNSFGTTNSTALVLSVVAPTQFDQVLLQLQPLAYWPLDETTGTVAYDVIGGNNGTYLGGFTLQQAGPTNSFFGGSSSSTFFDGVSGYVDIPEGPFNLTNALTLMVWVNPQVFPTHFTDILGHGDNSWRISLNQNSPPQPGANDGSVPADATYVPGIAVGSWHMLAYTYTGVPGNNNGTFYVDGAPVAQNNVTAVPSGNNLDVWIAGAPDYGTGANGRLVTADIAHCAIFNQSLSAAQIQAIYTGVYTPPVFLNISTSGHNVIVTWPNGKLLQAPTVTGPWTTNSAATSPYTNAASGTSQFYRVQVSP